MIDSGHSGRGGNGDDEEDEALWAHVARSVTPIDRDDVRMPSAARPEKPVKSVQRRLQDSASPVSTASSPPEKPAALPGLDHRTAERFRRGKMPIEAVLDLHGMNVSEAYPAFIRFVRDCHGRGLRCVLVITGKGRRRGDSGGGDPFAPAPGILRRSLPGWAEDPALAGLILRLSPARPQHGGNGAFYLLLRRTR